MILTRGRIAAFLLGVVLMAPAFAVPFDIALEGFPSRSDGQLWALKSGTQNTKQALESTAGALNVYVSGGVAPTPSATPTDVNIKQVNGVTQLTGAGATGAGSERVTIAVSSDTVAGSAALPAGTAIIGKVTTDQTTHGTTDLVAADNTKINGVAISVGSGVLGTGTQRVVLATDQPTVPVSAALPAAAAILTGYQTFTATTGATTLITITAGKTAVGTFGGSLDCNVAAASSTACKARVVFATTGAGVTPAAGTFMACHVTGGANAATGTVGSNGAAPCGPNSDQLISCASGTCTVTVTTTQAGTASQVDVWFSGTQQ